MVQTPTKTQFPVKAIFFLLSSYILDFFKEHLLSVHLKEPSKQNSSNIDPTEDDYEKKVFTIKMPTTENKSYFCTLKSLELLFFSSKPKNTVEKHDLDKIKAHGTSYRYIHV